MPSVTFQSPTDEGAEEESKTLEIHPGQSIFELARKNAVMVETACVGKGTCGLCRIKVISGEEHLNEYTDKEEKHLGNVYFITKVRLACQTLVTGGDVTVKAQKRRKSNKKKLESDTAASSIKPS